MDAVTDVEGAAQVLLGELHGAGEQPVARQPGAQGARARQLVLLPLQRGFVLTKAWEMLKDPANDMVLETAVNGRAELLVTFNRRHFAKAARLFELEIASPGEALTRLETEHETK